MPLSRYVLRFSLNLFSVTTKSTKSDAQVFQTIIDANFQSGLCAPRRIEDAAKNQYGVKHSRGIYVSKLNKMERTYIIRDVLLELGVGAAEVEQKNEK